LSSPGEETVESTARKRVAGACEGSLSEVIHACRDIYQKGAEAYRVLANNTMSEEISDLWRSLAEGLNKHIMYWEKISERIEKGQAIEVLGNPYEALSQLRDVEAKIDKIQESCTAFRSVMDYFYLAYSLEVQLTHPALCSLPESVMLVPDREIVKWDYQTNLKGFLAGMKKHCESHYLHEALVDSLERMWSQNRRMDQQKSVDPVTGAYNRRSLQKVISSFSSLAERDGHNVAIIMIGVENMHDLYTTFDMKTADEVVQRFYNGIKPGIRVSDILGRYDFSTFLIYLSKVHHQYLYEIAHRFAESTQSIHKAGFVLSVHIGGSYGLIRGETGQRIGTYLTRARDCLMRAKLSRTQRIIIE
jgi:diguanylate cyclase (GGDEF)-like protein